MGQIEFYKQFPKGPRLLSPKKGCIQVCMHIDHNRVMFKCINITSLENTQPM
jgi:hypothetical protein